MTEIGLAHENDKGQTMRGRLLLLLIPLILLLFGLFMTAVYPKGLQKEEILVAGRIVELCDVFDALTSRRPYKPAFSFEAAVAEIRTGRGTQFDPQITDLFIQVLPQIREIWERLSHS